MRHRTHNAATLEFNVSFLLLDSASCIDIYAYVCVCGVRPPLKNRASNKLCLNFFAFQKEHTRFRHRHHGYYRKRPRRPSASSRWRKWYSWILTRAAQRSALSAVDVAYMYMHWVIADVALMCEWVFGWLVDMCCCRSEPYYWCCCVFRNFEFRVSIAISSVFRDGIS